MKNEKAAKIIGRLKAEAGVDLAAVATPLTEAPNQSPPLSTPTKAESEIPAPGTTKQAEAADELDLDAVVQEQIDVLEGWVDHNTKKAERDFLRFWAFKLPAIACSVSVAAFESLGFGVAVIVLGVISAFCVGVDALFPGGRLHNVHKRAANEARRLQHDAIGRWRKAQLGKESERRNAVAGILDFVQKERERIDKYLTDAESSLGITDSKN
jgi:hypothetical protein